MIKRSSNTDPKGWLAGPWDSDLAVAIGFANAGIDEPHRHMVMSEVYLIAQGTSVALVDDEEVALSPGDMLIVDPGETHTFTQSSADYFHFVLQTPFVAGDKESRR